MLVEESSSALCDFGTRQCLHESKAKDWYHCCGRRTWYHLCVAEAMRLLTGLTRRPMTTLVAAVTIGSVTTAFAVVA
jgi:hypothetical protein